MKFPTVSNRVCGKTQQNVVVDTCRAFSYLIPSQPCLGDNVLNNFQVPDATIPVGQTLSNVYNSAKHHMTAEAIWISAPAALDAGTYSFDVNDNPNAVATSPGWTTLQIGDPAADAAPPGVGKARVYYELPACPSWRIKGPAAVGVDRIFKVSASGYAG